MSVAASAEAGDRVVGSAQHVEQLCLAGQRQRTAGRLRVGHVLLGHGVRLESGLAVALQLVPQPGQQLRLSAGSERDELVGPGPQRLRVAGQAGQEPTLEDQYDAQVLRHREPGGWHLEDLLRRRDRARHQGESGVAQSSPEPADRIADVQRQGCVRSSCWQCHPFGPRDVAEHGELTRELGAGADMSRSTVVHRQLGQGVVGDLDARALPALHVQRECQVGEGCGRQAGQPASAAEGDRGGQVDLGLREVAQPGLGHAELGDQERQQRLRLARAHERQDHLAGMADRGHDRLGTHPGTEQPGTGNPGAQRVALLGLLGLGHHPVQPVPGTAGVVVQPPLQAEHEPGVRNRFHDVRVRPGERCDRRPGRRASAG